MERDLSKGSVLKNIIIFSLPFFLSYFMQTFYGLADMFIIGQFCESDATTAVANGSQIMHMLTVMLVGLAMGTTVLIGRAVGAGDSNLKNKAIGNTISLFAIVSVSLTVIVMVFVKPIINVMRVPADAVSGTKNYLLICFAGIPFITAYNVISAIFRGMGDSKSPMYFIGVACVFNIALDYLFIGAFGMGPMGAALGTTLAQTISVIVALIAIIKKKMITGLKKEDLRYSSKIASSIIKVGLPVSLQDGLIQVSFILITIFVNERGSIDAAAVGIVEKLICILFLVPSSLLSSVSAICSQNFGADKPERARKTTYYALAIAFFIGILFGIIFQFFATETVHLFTKSDVVAMMGGAYFRSYVWDCAFAGLHFVFSGYFCARGRSIISFIHNIIAIVLIRIPVSYYASVHYKDTLFPMGLAAPLGSLLSAIICVIAFLIITKKERHIKAKTI